MQSRMMKIPFSIFIVIILAFGSSWAAQGQTTITWLGHASFQIITPRGTVVLIDPWLKNPKAPKIINLKKVDLILVTHGHPDHVGESFELAKKYGATLIASAELADIAKKKGVKDVLPVNVSGSHIVKGIIVTATQAVHSSSYSEDSKRSYAGSALGFIIELGNQIPAIYHAGDIGVFQDMALIKELHHPVVAFLPIGGVLTMGPREAGVAAKMLGSKVVVPMHYGTSPQLTGNPQMLKAELTALPDIKVREMIPGEVVELAELLKP